MNLGSPLKLEMIKEGHDVYFLCEVDANPPASSIEWHHNVKMIYSFFPSLFIFLAGQDDTTSPGFSYP